MECRCRPPYLETLRSLASLNRGAFVAMAGSLVAASSVRAAAATAGAADAILINGRFRTMAAASVADAVAITGGRFSAIGSRTHVMTYRGPQTEIVDLRGATVLPGFVEPHMHFIYQIVIANLLVARYPQCASLEACLLYTSRCV